MESLDVKAEQNLLRQDFVDQYEYRLSFDPAENEHFATVAEFPYLSVFATTHLDALEEIKNVVEDILIDMRRDGRPLPKPKCQKQYSGKFIVRIPCTLHRSIAQAAEEQNTTLNSYVISLLSAHHK